MVRAERVARVVPGLDADGPPDDHRGEPDRVAYDALVHLVRTT